MSRPSRDHLLGFLLDALAPDEHEQVEAELQESPGLRAELHRLKSTMTRLGLGGPPPMLEPPARLAARTCEYVLAQSRVLLTPAGTIAFQAPERLRRFSWSDLVTVAAVVVAAAS